MSNTTKAKMAGLVLKGLISEAPPEVQAKVAQAADELHTIVSLNGDEGKVALALVMTEQEDFS